MWDLWRHGARLDCTRETESLHSAREQRAREGSRCSDGLKPMAERLCLHTLLLPARGVHRQGHQQAPTHTHPSRSGAPEDPRYPRAGTEPRSCPLQRNQHCSQNAATLQLCRSSAAHRPSRSAPRASHSRLLWGTWTAAFKPQGTGQILHEQPTPFSSLLQACTVPTSRTSSILSSSPTPRSASSTHLHSEAGASSTSQPLCS